MMSGIILLYMKKNESDSSLIEQPMVIFEVNFREDRISSPTNIEDCDFQAVASNLKILREELSLSSPHPH